MKKILLLLILVVVASCSSSNGSNPAPTPEPTPTPTVQVEYDATKVDEEYVASEHIVLSYDGDKIVQIDIVISYDIGLGNTYIYKVIYEGSEAIRVEARDNSREGIYNIVDKEIIKQALAAAENRAYIEPIDPIIYKVTGEFEGEQTAETLLIYNNNGLIEKIEAYLKNSISEFLVTFDIAYEGNTAIKITQSFVDNTSIIIENRNEIDKILNAANNKEFITPILPEVYYANGTIGGLDFEEVVEVYNIGGKIEQIAGIADYYSSHFEFYYNIIYEGSEASKIEVITYYNYNEEKEYNNIITDREVIGRILAAAENKEFIELLEPSVYEATGSFEGEEYNESVFVFHNKSLIMKIETSIYSGGFGTLITFDVVYEGSNPIKIIQSTEGYAPVIIEDRNEIDKILNAARNQEFIG